MRQLIYYKNQPNGKVFPEDFIKTCGLSPDEINENFHNLKEDGVEFIYWDTNNDNIIFKRAGFISLNETPNDITSLSMSDFKIKFKEELERTLHLDCGIIKYS